MILGKSQCPKDCAAQPDSALRPPLIAFGKTRKQQQQSRQAHRRAKRSVCCAEAAAASVQESTSASADMIKFVTLARTTQLEIPLASISRVLIIRTKWTDFHTCRQEIEIPKPIANSVVRLRAPNSDAPEGHTDVYLLGMSHVSKESVEAVRSLVAAVRPEVASSLKRAFFVSNESIAQTCCYCAYKR